MMRVSQILGSEAKRIRALNTPADLYIINRENVVWLVDYYRNAWPFDMVVIDESSSFKSHKAKRFKALASVSSRIGRMVELTGTPSPNGLEDLWAQVYLWMRGIGLESGTPDSGNAILIRETGDRMWFTTIRRNREPKKVSYRRSQISVLA